MRSSPSPAATRRSPISDGITMGTEGMKTSLVSREVIADSIELTVRGYQFDAVVALSGCDKTIPDLGWDHDGHRGNEDIAGQPRGDRRLDRTHRPRVSVRCGRRPLRLRQDDPRSRMGSRWAPRE